jgi:hypothetical protein
VNDAAAVVRLLWEAFEARDWALARTLLHPELLVEWPVTGERFDREAFLRVNETYPETWAIELRRLTAAGDVVVAELWVDHTEPERRAWAVGRYEVEDGLIRRSTEYWAAPSEVAPERREAS